MFHSTKIEERLVHTDLQINIHEPRRQNLTNILCLFDFI